MRKLKIRIALITSMC